jgi:membrane protein implicated in regulation of membrane protease activity
MGNISEIITAAASSPLGILALAMILLSSVALKMFPPTATTTPVRIIVFVMLAIGAMLAVWAVLKEAESTEQNSAASIDDRSEQAEQPDGFARYAEKRGELTGQGRFRLLRTGLSDFDSLEPGDILRAEDEVNLREHPFDNARPLDLIRGGECVRVVSRARNEASVDATSAGWVAVKRATCP